MKALWVSLLMAGCATDPVFIEHPQAEPRHDRIWPVGSQPTTQAVLERSSLAATVPQEDSIFSLSLSWNYPNSVQTFRLYIGRESRRYDTVIDIGENTYFELWKTNWLEASSRHFYAVTAVDPLGRESDYSNEILFPPYPPDRFLITWTDPSPATILTSTNLSAPWMVIGSTQTGTTAFFDTMRYSVQFFRLVRPSGQPDTLKFVAYNPLNQ